MALEPSVAVPNFFNQLAPGGRYFKYAKIAILGLGFVFLALIVVFFLPQIKSLFIKPQPQRLGVSCASPGPLPRGFQTWEFSHGDAVTGPRIKTATIDTLTPPQGSAQTLSLTIKHDSPVTKAIAEVHTDSSSNTYDLNLIKGTNTDGTWVGTWKINDSYNCVYFISIALESKTGSWTGALTFR